MKEFIKKFNFPSSKMLIIWIIIFAISVGVLLPVMGNYIGIFVYPDNTFLLTYSKLYAYIAELGVSGIERYVVTKYSLDIVWPLVYIMFLTVLINYLRRFIKMEWYLNLLSIIGFVFDMLENLFFASYLTNHGSEFVGYIGITCNYIKWIVLFSLVGILIYKIIVYKKFYTNKNKEGKK